ncbi:hypothetical protein QWZ10_19290 [Paracoccus cavernae]|uniref:Uncharacterized protein n=2 Tax=Paracoccus cavernae TaxID=1571207 RepID=A0ABT8DBR2_9RHOB|nr:hypothetical protein [Paracoccus cavernae]
MVMEGTRSEREGRVDALLLEPLAGLKRGKDKDGRRLGAEAHEKMVARLRSWLGYLDDDQLSGLLNQIVVMSVSGEWPTEFHIRQVAMRMAPPPPEVSPYPRSMMVSALGRRAVAEGWAVEMYHEVLHHGPPPFQDGGWKEKLLRKEAAENEETAIRVRERVAAGQASDRDIRWLAARERDLAAVLEMQAEKRQQHG